MASHRVCSYWHSPDRPLFLIARLGAVSMSQEVGREIKAPPAFVGHGRSLEASGQRSMSEYVSPMPNAEIYRMSSIETALGFVFGQVEAVAVSEEERLSPRAALENVVRQHLMRSPCGVSFSGGRDSSAILALAVHVARRDALPDPIPITRIFRNASRTEEYEWQELVVRHLGINDWERLSFTDELDLVGPLARENISRHGVIWSPLIHANTPSLDLLRGGSLLDGEGGDEVLGVHRHRIEPVNRLLRTPRNVSRSSARAIVRACAPTGLRVWRARRRAKRRPHRWLTPKGQAAWADAMAHIEGSSPFSHSASIRHVARARSAVLFVHNLSTLALARDIRVASPFLRPEVVDALARQAGWLGIGSRTDALRAIIPDLLPDSVIARESKAEFGQAYFASYSREFVEEWDGRGVDTELVDIAGLRREWQSERPSALTSSLLQAAWRATHQGRVAPDSQ